MEHTFTMTKEDGHTLLTSQEYPWCVLQVVPTTPDTYLRTYSQLLHRLSKAEIFLLLTTAQSGNQKHSALPHHGQAE